MKKTRYSEIYDELRKRIHQGEFKAGDLLPTDLQISEEYKVSRPTAAKAFSLLKEDGWIERKSGLGTIVKYEPRGRRWNVGLLIPHLGETEIFEPICGKIAEFANEENIKLHWTAADRGFDGIASLARRQCQSCIDNELDGVFFTPIEHVDDSETINREILERLIESGIAVVMLDRDILPWPQQTSNDLVGIDNVQAGYVVASHLLEQGSRKIVFATAPKPAMTVKLRIMGCREAIVQSGLSPDKLSVLELDPNNAKRNVSRIMKRKPDGLVCANDETAANLLRPIVDSGIEIPQTLKVAAFDDVKYASLLSVPLTTYRQPCREIGQVAGQAMLERLEHRERAARRIFLKGKLIVRQSTSS